MLYIQKTHCPYSFWVWRKSSCEFFSEVLSLRRRSTPIPSFLGATLRDSVNIIKKTRFKRVTGTFFGIAFFPGVGMGVMVGRKNRTNCFQRATPSTLFHRILLLAMGARCDSQSLEIMERVILEFQVAFLWFLLSQVGWSPGLQSHSFGL